MSHTPDNANGPTRAQIVRRLRATLRGQSPLEVLAFLGPAIAMLWAGAALAGNVLVAAAKFETGLPYPDLLQVGVVQFQWVGYLEWVLAATWLLALWPRRRAPVVLMFAVPVVLLLIQKLGIHPFLHERTLATIAGEDPGESSLHIVYAALEGVKIIVLVAIGLIGTLVHSAPAEPSPGEGGARERD